MLKTKAKSKAKKTSFRTNSKENKEKEKCNQCGNIHSDKCRHINSTCNKCGKKSHLESVCKNKAKKSNDTPKLQNKIVCTMKTCLSLPLICMAKFHSSTQNLFNLLLNFSAMAHIICNKNLFQKGTFQSKTGYLETGSGEVLKIEGKGFLLILLDDGNKIVIKLILTNILYILRLKFNLISICKLGKKRSQLTLWRIIYPLNYYTKTKLLA